MMKNLIRILCLAVVLAWGSSRDVEASTACWGAVGDCDWQNGEQCYADGTPEDGGTCAGGPGLTCQEILGWGLEWLEEAFCPGEQHQIGTLMCVDQQTSHAYLEVQCEFLNLD